MPPEKQQLSTPAPWLSALKVQFRVLWALMLRETKTRYGRMRMGYLWALVEPMIFVAIFFILFTLGGRTLVSGMPLMPFLITGASTFILFRDSMQTSIFAINSNKTLLTFPQVTVFDLVLARVLLEIATHYTAAILLILGVAYFTGPVQIENPLIVTAWFFSAGMLGFGGGLAFGSLAALFPTVQQLIPSFVLRPMFFISGLFFTAEMAPEGVRDLALINPLLQITELVRSAFFIEFESEYAVPSYVILFLLSVVLVGLITQLAFRRRILSLPG